MVIAMSSSQPIVDQRFVDKFNDTLAVFGSSASIAASSRSSNIYAFDLLSDESEVLALFPSTTTPLVVEIAYRLYQRGLQRGRGNGEEAA